MSEEKKRDPKKQRKLIRFWRAIFDEFYRTRDFNLLRRKCPDDIIEILDRECPDEEELF